MKNNELAEIIKIKGEYSGLSDAEVEKKREEYGLNERPTKKDIGCLRRLMVIFTEPMMLLIIFAVVIYFFIGEITEALIFLGAIVPIGAITYIQQRRTDRAVAQLDKILEQWVKVYRNGKLITENVKQLVPGDLVHLAAGDKLPADGYVLEGYGLMVDESALTGESMPVAKMNLSKIEQLDNEKYKLFQGSLVVQGEAKFFVIHTGVHTEYGRLGSLLDKITHGRSPLQKKIHHIIKYIAVIAVALTVIIGSILYLNRGLKDGLIGGLTMGMALIPEEFPIVFSVFMIMGVWRMARKKSLVRELVTVEALGSATVIAVDKTGTLTEGRMSLSKIYYKEKEYIINNKNSDNQELLPLIKKAVLSLERSAHDPLEVEMQRFAQESGIDLEKFFNQYDLVFDSPFDANTKMVHHLWMDKNKSVRQYTVGAPESVIECCDLSQKEKKQIYEKYEQFASEGLRVIALAEKECLVGGKKVIKTGLSFTGLVAMSDPPRVETAEAIKICQEAGIRVIMITGDHKLTAKSIANKIGLKFREEILSGDDLISMSSSDLSYAVKHCDIFARVRPEQKYEIVEALQINGEIVAMTGDGVNDAPALKKADIGIAMGQKGTEVARESAGMILLDDNFFSITQAIKEGRRIYYNLQQAFSFLISFHIPIVGLALIPAVMGQSLIFLPIHIIFLELICDPTSVLGFENEKAPKNIMTSPPRPPKEPLISKFILGRIIVYGLMIFLISAGCYFFFNIYYGGLSIGRTTAFTALVFSQIMMVFLMRDWHQIKTNLILTGIGFITIMVMIIIIYTPTLRNIFHFTLVPPVILGAVLLVSFIGIGLPTLFFRLLIYRGVVK